MNDTDSRVSEPAAHEAGSNGAEQRWYQAQVSRVMLAGIVEQRRSRRWGILFKSLFLLYLGVVLALLIPEFRGAGPAVSGEHTAVVELKGVIDADGKASADDVISGLRDAFEDDATVGVILRLNTPGGSPVQSANIHDEIGRLREEYPDIPMYAVIEDVGASGGYFVAVATDEIYANRSSLVGSIGVRTDSFGFVDAIEKLGVQRRLFTAGTNKASLDPFLPLKSESVAHLETLLDGIHQHFIEAVEEGRGSRLKGDRDDLFSGEVWTGKQALELGLVDGLGDIRYVAREKIGAETLVDFTTSRDLFTRLAERVQTLFSTVLDDRTRLSTRW